VVQLSRRAQTTGRASSLPMEDLARLTLRFTEFTITSLGLVVQKAAGSASKGPRSAGDSLVSACKSILERIWAPDFVYVEPSGHRFTKAEGIAALKTGGERHTVSAASSIDVRVYGGGTVAVDIGDYTEAGSDKNGKPFERTSRFTNVWVLKDGAWQCVSGHASAIPTSR